MKNWRLLMIGVVSLICAGTSVADQTKVVLATQLVRCHVKQAFLFDSHVYVHVHETMRCWGGDANLIREQGLIRLTYEGKSLSIWPWYRQLLRSFCR